MATYVTQQQSSSAYQDSVVYSFKILVDSVAVKDTTPSNPPDESPPPVGWVGVYPDKIFSVQVQNGLNAQQEILNFVTNYKNRLENPVTPITITEVSL